MVKQPCLIDFLCSPKTVSYQGAYNFIVKKVVQILIETCTNNISTKNIKGSNTLKTFTT